MSTPYYQDDAVTVLAGDCLDVMTTLADASVDAVVCDPPYGLEFMGKDWDGADGFRRSLNAADTGRESVFGRTSAKAPEYRTDSAFQEWCEAWATECLRVLKPGGHILAFGGSRTWHRLQCAIEDAGFEIRDSIAWLYGSGFPKSLDVSKAIDKAARGVPQGAADPTSPNHGRYRTTTTEGKRWDGDSGQSYGAGGSRFLADTASARTHPQNDAQPADSPHTSTPDATDWQGWGTALKPAFEPIVVGRKPLAGTVAANVLAHGTGALNIDACRTAGETVRTSRNTALGVMNDDGWEPKSQTFQSHDAGRWPTNAVLDDTQAADLDAQTGILHSQDPATRYRSTDPAWSPAGTPRGQHGSRAQTSGSDVGGASRFFPTFRYEAKAPTAERPVTDDGTAHPTVKPLDLMRWLVRLVTPRGGLVLDPFLGSGTTAEACVIEGFRCIGIERDTTYLPLIVGRLSKPIQSGFDFGESA